tara:strand:- start:3393 stop:4169 length:777 start_codon:yes stop_codon:yes gene_type:complete
MTNDRIVLVNTCDCSGNIPILKPCVPEPGSNCILPFDCSKNPQMGWQPTWVCKSSKLTPEPCVAVGGCTSLDAAAAYRRIQNQSRMPSSQFTGSIKSITVSSSILNFKGSEKNKIAMSSRVWGNPYYLRNQSDRVTPSRSGEFVAINNQNDPIKYINVPSRGNSTKSTITANRPGAMTPGGEGVDVKHGSYNRYLAKKKGIILSQPSVTVTRTAPLPLLSYRRQKYNDRIYAFNSSGMNNYIYKFSPISLSSDCNNCN